MQSRIRAVLGVVFLFVAALPQVAHAQATTGTIYGIVTDESKAVLPGVAVVVTNTETGVARSLTTDERGGYRALNLVPGIYSVTAQLQGFTSAKRDRLVVEIGRDVSADLQMGVGAVTEQVTVEGAATNVELSSAVAGGVVSPTQIAELPLNGRNFMQLATLQPGVAVSRGTGRDFTGGFGTTQVAIGGARPEMTGYLLEGTNIADISDKAPSSMAGVMLGVDAVKEFSVQTHDYSAEFGRAAGGVISAVTKSGTNGLHGTMFEFLRNSRFDQPNYFDPVDPATGKQDGAAIHPQSVRRHGGRPDRQEQGLLLRQLRRPAAGSVADPSGAPPEPERAQRPRAERGGRADAGRDQPARQAVPRSAVSDSERPGLRRRHGAAQSHRVGSDARELLRRQGRLAGRQQQLDVRARLERPLRLEDAAGPSALPRGDDDRHAVFRVSGSAPVQLAAAERRSRLHQPDREGGRHQPDRQRAGEPELHDRSALRRDHDHERHHRRRHDGIDADRLHADDLPVLGYGDAELGGAHGEVRRRHPAVSLRRLLLLAVRR